jgi:hypothetical protein
MLYTFSYKAYNITPEEATTKAFEELRQYLNDKNNLHETDDSKLP